MLLFTKGGRGRVDKKEEIRIVKKAIKGKPDAYGQLISEYQKYLYRVAFLYMKNEQEALDIVGNDFNFIRREAKLMGQTAGELMIHRIAFPSEPVQNVFLESEIVIRKL